MSEASNDPRVELVIEPRKRDLGGFFVRRVLPYVKKRTIGPFIFLDHMGPVTYTGHTGIDVRPHPHIGLSTLTYLFNGEIMHRDSLGYQQVIRPGDVNWMTAGRGIVHSERMPPGAIVEGAKLHGLQFWVALPKVHEETSPAFTHHPKATLPRLSLNGVQIDVIAGSAFGATSPVRAFSDMVFANCVAASESELKVEGRSLSGEPRELAVYVIDGEVEILGGKYGEGQMAVLTAGATFTVHSRGAAHFVIVGGEALDGPREIWWNFVASSKELMERAKKEWRKMKFPLIPTDHAEFIPLPDDAPVRSHGGEPFS